MIRRSFLSAVLAAVFVMPLVANRSRAADPAGVKSFDTWTATCNNLADCVVVGAVDGELLTLRVIRGAKPDAEPEVKMTFVRTDEDKKPPGVVRLTAVDGPKKTPLSVPPATVSQDDERFVRIELPAGGPSRGFVDGIRDAASLSYKIGGTEGSFGLKGISAALRWIDDRQGRAGTATALVARGMTSNGQIPATRPAPVVTAAPAGSAAEVDKPAISAALKKAMPRGDECEAELLKAPDAAESLFAWRLGPDRLLVFVPCSRGAYNFSAALFFTDIKGGSPRPVELPHPAAPRDGVPPNILTNAEFDPGKMELSEFAKGRGLGDCGSQTTWVWTGKDFELLSASLQTTCAGLVSDDWPNIYTAVRK